MKYKKLKYNVDFLISGQRRVLNTLLKAKYINDDEAQKSIDEILEGYVACKLAKSVGLSSIEGTEKYKITLNNRRK